MVNDHGIELVGTFTRRETLGELVIERLLVHISGFNLSLVLRLLTGKGTPRGLQDLAIASFFIFVSVIHRIRQLQQSTSRLLDAGKRRGYLPRVSRT